MYQEARSTKTNCCTEYEVLRMMNKMALVSWVGLNGATTVSTSHRRLDREDENPNRVSQEVLSVESSPFLRPVSVLLRRVLFAARTGHRSTCAVRSILNTMITYIHDLKIRIHSALAKKETPPLLSSIYVSVWVRITDSTNEENAVIFCTNTSDMFSQGDSATISHCGGNPYVQINTTHRLPLS